MDRRTRRWGGRVPFYAPTEQHRRIGAMMKRKARVLVVDDEIEIVRALQRSLTGHGYEVLAVGSGEEALEAIGQRVHDLMLLDLALPGMSGLEVCKQVREQSDRPIIVISAKNKERDKGL